MAKMEVFEQAICELSPSLTAHEARTLSRAFGQDDPKVAVSHDTRAARGLGQFDLLCFRAWKRQRSLQQSLTEAVTSQTITTNL